MGCMSYGMHELSGCTYDFVTSLPAIELLSQGVMAHNVLRDKGTFLLEATCLQITAGWMALTYAPEGKQVSSHITGAHAHSYQLLDERGAAEIQDAQGGEQHV